MWDSYLLQLSAMLFGCTVSVAAICIIAFVLVMAGKSVDE